VISRGSKPEDALAWQLRAVKAPAFERQFRIHPDRKFLADFYFPLAQLVVECDGGGFVGGRHGRGLGIEKDAEKSAYIACMPARLLRVTPTQIKDGRALAWVLEAVQMKRSVA
jgi:very-short-patch-repair endonuclease